MKLSYKPNLRVKMMDLRVTINPVADLNRFKVVQQITSKKKRAVS